MKNKLPLSKKGKRNRQTFKIILFPKTTPEWLKEELTWLWSTGDEYDRTRMRKDKVVLK